MLTRADASRSRAEEVDNGRALPKVRPGWIIAGGLRLISEIAEQRSSWRDRGIAFVPRTSSRDSEPERASQLTDSVLEVLGTSQTTWTSGAYRIHRPPFSWN
jgi:hypothetical protein